MLQVFCSLLNFSLSTWTTAAMLALFSVIFATFPTREFNTLVFPARNCSTRFGFCSITAVHSLSISLSSVIWVHPRFSITCNKVPSLCHNISTVGLTKQSLCIGTHIVVQLVLCLQLRQFVSLISATVTKCQMTWHHIQKNMHCQIKFDFFGGTARIFCDNNLVQYRIS